MFKMSTRGRYGVRLMLDLATNQGTGPVALKDVARRQEISMKYLEHLAASLKKAKLLRSARGARGGYVLAFPPSSITIKDVVAAVDGSVCLVKCTRVPSACRRSGDCLSRGIWSEFAEKISRMLDDVSLEQVIEKAKARVEPMYFI
ncbi:MAG: RrF2 family transcriptional regulator [Candidatus Aminicenantales bacterium]